MKFVRSVITFLCPESSKRIFILKLIIKIILHPVESFRNMFDHEKWAKLQQRLLKPVTYKKKIRLRTLYMGYRKLVFPRCEKPLVSIIIPVYNKFRYTYNCLYSILKYTNGIAYEVIVVDDRSQDRTVNLPEYAENIRVIVNEENLGFLRNCNKGAKIARGSFLLFLNNDTQVQPGWLSSLCRTIQSDATIGMVGSQLLYPDGRLQEAGGIVWSDGSAWNFGRFAAPGMPEYNYQKEVDYISGASIMIRRDLWEKIGRFDERYIPAYCEDTDLAFEVRRHGFKVVFDPKSVVVHFEGVSNGTDVKNGIKKYQVENNKKFVEKWRHLLETEQYPHGTELFKARDRSRKRKTIVVIDHYVPMFDRDAGSRTTFQYLELFIEMGFNVKFLSDNFRKDEPYTSILEKMGIEVLYGQWYFKNWQHWLSSNAPYIDFIFLNRPHISIKYLDFIKQHLHAKILYHGHDLHYLRVKRQLEVEQKPTVLRNSDYWKEIESEIFTRVDDIVTVSVEEQKIIRRDFNIDPDKVHLFPIFFYEHGAPAVNNFTHRDTLLFVGGFSHQPNVDGILWFYNEIYPAFKAAFPDAKLVISGSNPPKQIKRLASASVQVTGYVSDEELSRLYTQARVVIVPLRYGSGVKGKVIEAMYHGVPLVGTSSALEGIAGIEALYTPKDCAEDFKQELCSLYRDEKKLCEQSLKSSRFVVEQYTKEAAYRVMKEIFKL